MKFTTIYSGENTIELHNSMLGKETVKVNDEIVSSKYSITGTEHTFSVTENGETQEGRIVTGFSPHGVVFDYYQNGKPIVVSEKGGCLVFLIIFLVFVVIGFMGSSIWG